MTSADAELTPTIRLLRQLGAGGMGTVWAAHHATLGTEVAVKLLSEERDARADLLARVRREVKAASRVKSPHVVKMIDCGAAADGRPYLVMELLEGTDLGDYLESRGSLPPSELIAIVRQIAHALGKAHEQGIIHRDVKPSNVFLCEGTDGPFVKLLDFGIAKVLHGDKAGTTSTGGGAGTPTAMSPEQIVGGPIDHRSDIWALGVLVFRALTGRAPYEGETLGALALAIHNRPAASMCALEPSLPASLDEWFSRACARRKEDRFGDVADAMRALERAADGDRESSASRAVALPVSTPPRLASTDAAGWSQASIASSRAPARFAVAFVALTVAALAVAGRLDGGRGARADSAASHESPLLAPAVATSAMTALPSSPDLVLVAATAPPNPVSSPIAPPRAALAARAHRTPSTASTPPPVAPRPGAYPPAAVAQCALEGAEEFPHERH